MAAAQSSFVWYELLSDDVAAAKSFYAHVVGWNMQDVPMPGMTYTVLRAGVTQVGGLMASPAAASDGNKSGWFGYVGVHDADSAAAKVKRLGGAVLKEPADIPKVGRFAVVADPQGAVFNVFKPAQAGEPSVSSEAGQVGWRELHTADSPKAFDFYREMFGWTQGDAIGMGPVGAYQVFKIGGVAVGGMFDSPAAQAQRFWLFYFNVGDIDAAADRISSGGGKPMRPPQQVPGGGWIVQAVDPSGAAFALVGSRSRAGSLT